MRKTLEKGMPETLRLMLAPVEAFESANPVLRTLGSVGSLAALLASPKGPETPVRGELGIHKRVAWTSRIDLEEVRQVGKQLGGTINDVLDTARAGALRRYLLQWRSIGSRRFATAR